MPINFQCPTCKAKYVVKDTLSGKNATCKKCKGKMKIPSPEPEEDLIVAVEVKSPPKATTNQKRSSEAVTPSPASHHAAPSTTSSTPARPSQTASKKLETAATPQPNSFFAEALQGEISKVVPAASQAVALQKTKAPSQKKPQHQITSQEQLIAAITDSIQPVPTTFSYRVAALIVALIMVLLPLIYIGIIFLVAYGLFMYAVNGTAVFSASSSGSGRGQFALVLLYLGPLVIGIITTLFMIKPLFARRSDAERRRSLSREHEPKLFAFVDALCDAVHAPKPKRIDVNCDVNASASFRRGLFSVFVDSDLVLTIGMPLVACMSTRQLAGVLAHEFGHFSQGFGMRVSHITMSISYWFVRVVYERDEWDEWLANTANSIDLRIGIILHLARLMIWCTRRVLWVLMMIGQACSCFLLRQMEFDADLHEIRFSGSDNFRKSTMALRLTGIAYQQGIVDQRNFFMDGKLADDMPSLTKFNRDDQDDDFVKKCFKGVMDEETRWFTTHPVDKDRVARAKQENEPGVFQLEAPASDLFQHYEKICQGVTFDFFKSQFGDELKSNMLCPVEQLVTHKAASKEASQALARSFGRYFSVPRRLDISVPTAPPSDRQASFENLNQARQTMIRLLDAYSKSSEQFEKADGQWLLCHQCEGIQALGIKLKQKDFDVPVGSTQTTALAANNYRQKLADLGTQLTPMESAFVQRVQASLELLMLPDVQEKIGDGGLPLLYQSQTVLGTLPTLQNLYAEIVRFRNEFSQLALMLHVLSGSQEIDADVFKTVHDKIGLVQQSLQRLSEQFQQVSFPFQHADGAITLAQYLVPSIPTEEEVGELMEAGEKVLDGYHYVYFRSIGSLAQLCQAVESAFELPPQNEPPPREDEDDAEDASV